MLSISKDYPDFEAKLLEACQTLDVSIPLQEAIIYSLQAGGKRIRPLLTLTACKELGGNPSLAYPAAIAMELIHTYSLIHDDLPCMDDDDLRRGKPTNHKVFGEALAVLAGDALLTEAFSILSSPTWEISENVKLNIIHRIASCAGASGMVGGQALDLAFENQTCSLVQLENIHLHKTGKLLQASILAGTWIATQNKEISTNMENFANDIGLAFQIADDILDVTQSSETLGKNAGSDLKKNKSTYPSILGLEKAQEKLTQTYQKALTSLDKIPHPCIGLREIASYIKTRIS